MADGQDVASIGSRAAAGAIDAAAVALVAAAIAGVPWRLGGFSMPMIAALTAILVWNVAPLVAFGSTVGMRALGLRLCGLDGERPDAIEVAFRELLGRGLLPGSYLVVVVVGVVSTLVGSGDFHAPGRFGLLLVLASLATGLGAGAGHLLALARTDRRGLADLLGHTRVVAVASRSQSADDDARAEERLARRRVRRIFWGFEATLCLAALAGPIVLGRPEAHASQVLAQRLIRERSVKLFEANPGDPDVARELIDRLEKEGDAAGAARIEDRHRQAMAGVERERELKLRESIAKNPGNDASVDALVDLLLEQGRPGEARQTVLAYVEAVQSPRERVRCGAWMQGHGFPADAVALLRRAMDEGESEAESYGYLGLALRDLGRHEEARAALATASGQAPDWAELRTALQELGGEPGGRQQAGDAGR